MSQIPDFKHKLPYEIIQSAETFFPGAGDKPWHKVEVVDPREEDWPAFCPVDKWPQMLHRFILENGTYWIGECEICECILWYKEPIPK